MLGLVFVVLAALFGGGVAGDQDRDPEHGGIYICDLDGNCTFIGQ